MPVFTLVQHSAWVFGGDIDFIHAVEETGVLSKTDQVRISKAGGLLFDRYGEAGDRAGEENYPPEVVGLIPKARGTFIDRVKIGRSPLYIPAQPAQASDTKRIKAVGVTNPARLSATLETDTDGRQTASFKPTGEPGEVSVAIVFEDGTCEIKTFDITPEAAVTTILLE